MLLRLLTLWRTRWQVTTGSNVVEIANIVTYSVAGYYLATSADDSVVKLWDLRKLKNFKNITLEDKYEVWTCFVFVSALLGIAIASAGFILSHSQYLG